MTHHSSQVNTSTNTYKQLFLSSNFFCQATFSVKQLFLTVQVDCIQSLNIQMYDSPFPTAHPPGPPFPTPRPPPCKHVSMIYVVHGGVGAYDILVGVGGLRPVLPIDARRPALIGALLVMLPPNIGLHRTCLIGDAPLADSLDHLPCPIQSRRPLHTKRALPARES